MLRPSAAVVTALVALGLAACGGDKAAESQSTTAGAGDPARYCALTRQLDAAGEKFFAGLEADENAGPEEFQAAERRFIEQSSGALAELQRVAPREIKADVRKLLAGMRQRAGLENAGADAESQASAAEERIRAYERRNCGS